MTKTLQVKTVTLILIILPICWITLRYVNNLEKETKIPKYPYKITYQLSLFGNEQAFKLSTFLPVNTLRQNIKNLTPNTDTTSYQKKTYFEKENRKITWEGNLEDSQEMSYTFLCRGKELRFQIDPAIRYKPEQQVGDSTLQTEYLRIQFGHPQIKALSQELVKGENTLEKVLSAFYAYVRAVPSTGRFGASDALSVLEGKEIADLAKTRLFTALCLSAGIQARIVGGLDLREKYHKNPHLWAEVLVNEQWIPFDPIEGHFAAIPEHYLEIFSGDKEFIRQDSQGYLDYMILVEQEKTAYFPNLSLLRLWELIDLKQIPGDFTAFLILMPLGAFVVAIAKNVVGLKTYGVFLPVLIAYAFVNTGLWQGLVFMMVIITIISLLNFPLDYWGILHTPKLVLMLTVVVLLYMLSGQILMNISLFKSSTAFFFPIIILTITSEKFARKIDESGFREAFKIFAQTLLVILLCYVIISSLTIQYLLITFPELLLLIGGLSLSLGKWIGLRVTEYKRFSPVFKNAQ